jgi:hypothetical protein
MIFFLTAAIPADPAGGWGQNLGVYLLTCLHFPLNQKHSEGRTCSRQCLLDKAQFLTYGSLQ